MFFAFLELISFVNKQNKNELQAHTETPKRHSETAQDLTPNTNKKWCQVNGMMTGVH